MPTKKGQLPARTEDKAPIGFRAISFRTAEADSEKRSIPVTLATEAGVDVWDHKSRRMIKEHALMQGSRTPQQVVMVDSHNHDSVRNILGSIRDLHTNAGELRGTAYFADKPAAREAFNDIRDGHLTDISVGFWRLAERQVDDGKTETINGQRINGPARIVTDWQPFEGSAVTVGADRHSTFNSIPAMRAYFAPNTFFEESMNAELRSHLELLGMPKEHSDEQALAWMKENTARKVAEQPKPEPAKVTITPVDTEAIRKAAEEAVIAERKRAADIRASVRGVGLPDSFADGIITDGKSTAEASRSILEELAKAHKPHGAGGIVNTESEREKFRAAALDGVSMRLGWTPKEKPAAGSNEFRHLRFLDLARKAVDVESNGSTRGLSDREIMGRVFGGSVGSRASDGQAYHTTGNFANLLLDATNKTLLSSYQEVETTFQRWVRIAPSVPDFKTIYRMRLSEIGHQPMVPENDEYKDLSLSDNKESYKIEKHGSLVSLTWEAMVNDDLASFARIVGLQGAAMMRTKNLSVYNLLFSNPTMSDTGALFNSTAITTAGGHDNLVASDVSVAVLNTMFTKFALKKGINSDVILGLRPKYIICASGIYADMWQTMNSIADPAAGGSAAGNSNTVNIYGPAGSRSLEIIEEPLLDGNDADLWFAACPYNMIDTIELCHLQGEESPVFEQESAFVQDAVKFKIRQTWGVGAIDWRGLYKSTGA